MHTLIEALGGLVTVMGLSALVAAAAMVDVRLGVAVAGCFAVAIGFFLAYLASVLEQRAEAKPKAGERA